MPSADPQPTAPDAVAELAATPAGITIHGEATPEQADHARAVRSGSSHGPGGWRSSAQPR